AAIADERHDEPRANKRRDRSMPQPPAAPPKKVDADAGKAAEPTPQDTAKRAKPPKPSVTAETLGKQQREISVSEFFSKNRHLLGFDSPKKALLTTVKEAVDNSLDACEEAGILPDVTVKIAVAPKDGETTLPSASKAERFTVTVTDNGPGIVPEQIGRIF